MDMKEEMFRLLAEQTELALATCTGSQPNVRVVNFVFDPAKKVIYFSTFPDNDKVKEMADNPSVAFTTIPHEGNAHVKAKGTARQSALSIFDVADQFVKKIPDYQETIDFAGDQLLLYEVHFDQAVVTVDLEHIGTVTI